VAPAPPAPNNPAMSRPRTAAFLGMSLDGFIAGPNGELDWLQRQGGPPEDHGFDPFMASVDLVLMGRSTWEVVRAFPSWPYSKPVAVLTHRPGEAPHGERFLAGPPGEVLARLGAEGVGRLYVDGGAVVSQFLAAGLLDELTVSVLPVVLGAGIRLFQETGPERWLTLRDWRTWPSGLVQLRYVAKA
jgi:dihydrofolate reductase